MDRREKIVPAIILYNPEFESVITLLQNFLLPLFNKIILIDNSDQIDLSANFSNNSEFIYINNSDNVGIATALNQAAQIAIENSYEWLLTLDQDSYFENHELSKFIDIIHECPYIDKVGIFSPVHAHQKAYDSESYFGKYEEVLYTMTSGNLLNLNAYKECGPFLDALFIDHVDHEYGLRLNTNGFKVLICNDIRLNHSLGILKTVKILGMVIMKFISHSPLRTYYILRNGWYVSKLYKKEFPTFALDFNKILAKELLKNIFFEDQKYRRVKNILKAHKDFKKGLLGKYI